MGDSDDLKIYHDGDSYISHNGTGNIHITSNAAIDFYKHGTIDRLARFISNEGVELYYNAAKRFETSNIGVIITGETDVNGDLNVSGISTFTGAIDANGNLDVDGHTELDNLNVSGVSTFVGNASFAGNVSIAGTLTYEDVTNVDSIGFITARSGIHIGSPSIGSTLTSDGDLLMSRNLRVAGVSTFVGVGTFQNDLYVGGDLYVADDITIDELNVRDANITGIATIATLLDVTGHAELDTLNVSGVSTFVGIATFSNNVFVVGTLDAGLIDGGEF